MAFPFDLVTPKLVEIIRASSTKTGPDGSLCPDEKNTWKGYKYACDHAEEMAVHLSGTKPVKLLNRVRPREDPAITAYRLESYEPTTVSTLGKALAITGKIFNPKLYAIKPAENNQGKELFDYAVENYPVFNSVVNFLSSYALKCDLEDPNGIFIVEPGELPLKEDGEVDVTQQLNPIVTVFKTCDIWVNTRDYICIFLKKTEDEKINGLTAKIWYFKYIDKQSIYDFFVYTTNSTQYPTDIILGYNHNFGEIPAWKMGGEFDDKNIGLYKSYFYPSVPFLNKAITAESDLDGAFISHLHPIRWEVAEECEFVERSSLGEFPCQGGWISNPTGQKICPNCRGTGRKTVQSPHQVYQVAKDKLSDPQGNNLGIAPTGFVDVPTAATELLDKRVDKLHEKALSAINMDIVNEIGNNQSGEAKAYDRTELNDFLNKVRDLFYDVHLPNIFYFMARYMFLDVNKDSFKKIEPVIMKPVEYDILSTSEMIDQLQIHKGAQINPSYLSAKQLELQNKEFGNHPELLIFLNLVISLDPYPETTAADLDLAIARGTVSKVQAIIHDNIQDFVHRALEEDSKFKDKTYVEQMDILEGYAEDMSSDIEEEKKVEIDMTAIQPDNVNPNAPDPNNPTPDPNPGNDTPTTKPTA